MPRKSLQSWRWQNAIPVVALPAGVYGSRWFAGPDLTDKMMFSMLIGGPLTAFLIGLLLRPSRVWVAPAVMVLIACVEVGIREYRDPSENSVVGGLLYTFLMGFPLWTALIWFGRVVRGLLERQWASHLGKGSHRLTS